MSKIVHLIRDPIDMDSWTRHEVDDLCEFLTTQFETWPATGRIYHKELSKNNDVTPAPGDKSGIDRLQSLDGPFYVVIYPGEPVTIIIAVVAVIALAAVAVMIFLKPKATPPPPAVARASSANRQIQSPNNELSDRKNTPRIGGRIPDIYGTVRSVPDLIQAPFTIYENHRQVEIAYMCIGRGAYEITDVRDDTTLVADIAGSSVAVYGPNTTMNSGVDPELQIGQPINRTEFPVLNISRVTGVNGQTLQPPNDIILVEDVILFFPNEIRFQSVAQAVTDSFGAGDIIQINSFSVNTHQVTPPATVSRDFGGIYEVTYVDSTTIVLKQPGLVNAAWLNFTDTETYSPTIHLGGPRWIGPFVIEQKDVSYFYVNVVAGNGLYKDDGEDQFQLDVSFEIVVTPIDADGNAVSSEEIFPGTVVGHNVLRNSRAYTLKFQTAVANNRYKVKARRTTTHDDAFSGTVVDEIKWSDLYAASVADLPDSVLGNVTTVQTKTYATAGALSIKERRLNMLVTRKLPQRISGTDFTTDLFPTNNAADILVAICLDPYVGNRIVAEIDVDNLYDTCDEISTYFGTPTAAEFNHTFDADNVSFEETVTLIANAIFCTPYRRGNKIKIFFEKETEDSVLLFNHRNKVPGSEVRSIRFGNGEDNDGVELDYVSPIDDAILTYSIPDDGSAVNPKKIETIGVRSKVKAHMIAWREYNRIRYANIVSEFDAMQEADLLIPGERILVADNTRPNIQDGDVFEQVGLEITTSQDVVFQPGVDYTIFLQLYDGTIDSMPAYEGSGSNKILLDHAPGLELVMADDRYARTTYLLSAETDRGQIAFIVDEKESKENMTVTVHASNYDSRIYSHDTDYINDLIAEDDDGITYDGEFIIIIYGTPGAIEDLRAYADSRGYPGDADVTIKIDAAAIIQSASDTIPSLGFGDWDDGITIHFEVHGQILGHDGALGIGGIGGTSVPAFSIAGNGTNGGDGGDAGIAIDATDISGYNVEFIIFDTGSVKAGRGGGGGGGGGGGAYYEDTEGHQLIGGDGGLGDGSSGGASTSGGGYSAGAGGNGGARGTYGEPGLPGGNGGPGDGLTTFPLASTGGIGGDGGLGALAIVGLWNLAITNNGIISGHSDGEIDFTTGTLPALATYTCSTIAWFWGYDGNCIWNYEGAGSVNGTPGTVPTLWSVGTTANNVTRTVVGSGFDNGIPYIDVRYQGTPTLSGTITISPMNSGTVDAISGQVWTFSAYCKLQAGALTNVTSLAILIFERNAAGTGLASTSTSFTPTGSALNTQLRSAARTFSNGGTTNATGYISFAYTNAQAIDITFRIGLYSIKRTGSIIPSLYYSRVDSPRFTHDRSTGALLGLIHEPSAINSIRNDLASGVVAGTPGTAPSNWTVSTTANSVTRTIVGVGWEDGLRYMDIQYTGTPSASGSISFTFESGTQIVAASGQIWTSSFFMRLIAGAWTNVTLIRQVIAERDSGGTQLTNQTATILPTGAALRTQRVDDTRTLNQVTTARITNGFTASYTIALAVNFTVRIAIPQLVQTAVPLLPMVSPGSSATTRTAAVLTIACPDGTYDIDITRVSGVTNLTGIVVTAGAYPVPTDTSPLQKIAMIRTA